MKVRICAALLSLVAGSPQAAELCDGSPCSISFDFAAGGSISASNGATITFGPGGSLVLGTDGSITPGEGGSVTPDTAEMSGGGTVVLGAGGSIQFGEGGSLATGDGGGVSAADDGALDIAGARAASIDSQATVRLGSLTTDGNITMEAGGSMSDGETSTPINLIMPAGDKDSSITVNSDADITWKNIQGDPASITLTAGGSMAFSDNGSNTPGGSQPAAECGDPGSSGSTFTYSRTSDGYTGGWSCAQSLNSSMGGGYSYGVITLDSSPAARMNNSGSGALGWPGLLLLTGAAWLRRRLAA
jgi:hypothetical protein